MSVDTKARTGKSKEGHFALTLTILVAYARRMAVGEDFLAVSGPPIK